MSPLSFTFRQQHAPHVPQATLTYRPQMFCDSLMRMRPIEILSMQSSCQLSSPGSTRHRTPSTHLLGRTILFLWRYPCFLARFAPKHHSFHGTSTDALLFGSVLARFYCPGELPTGCQSPSMMTHSRYYTLMGQRSSPTLTMFVAGLCLMLIGGTLRANGGKRLSLRSASLGAKIVYGPSPV